LFGAPLSIHYLFIVVLLAPLRIWFVSASSLVGSETKNDDHNQTKAKQQATKAPFKYH